MGYYYGHSWDINGFLWDINGIILLIYSYPLEWGY
jgi:hypothetical protein